MRFLPLIATLTFGLILQLALINRMLSEVSQMESELSLHG